jgi:hypothetical protein
MHVAQIVAITASLVGVIVGLVYYLQVKSGDASYLSSSTWTISIPDESVTQTWYIDTDADVLKIVQHKEGQAALAIQEMHSGKTYEYSMWDRVESTVPADACDGIEGCDVAELQAQLDDAGTVKTDCTVEDLTDAVSLSAVEVGDTVVIGGFTVQFVAGVPTAIIDGEDGSVVATIDSIVDGIAGDVTFDGCAVEARRLDLEERELGFAEWASGTDWCGAGTDNCNTPCPGTGTGSVGDNMGCRRHDHGAVHSPAMWGLAVQLECQVDKDLEDYAKASAGDQAKAAILATFGSYGLANVWGCQNWAVGQNCWWHWAGCGWRGCPGWQRRCSSGWQWEVKNGFWRYNGINNRGAATIYVDKCQTCSGDIF